MPYVCPVCGYPDLEEPPYRKGSGGSDEICPSCGIHFGYHDARGNDDVARQAAYNRLRQAWIAGGMKWHAKDGPPLNWRPTSQLKNVKEG
jgi:hypothetical protein